MTGEQELIARRVHGYYWDEDLNCATTMLKLLAELGRVELTAQAVHAAAGMHGAGGYGGQCGLVEGALMFMGIEGTAQGLGKATIAGLCRMYAQAFEKQFGSIRCSQLRPQGFGPHNPPHLCEPLTREAVDFTARFIRENLDAGDGGRRPLP